MLSDLFMIQIANTKLECGTQDARTLDVDEFAQIDLTFIAVSSMILQNIWNLNRLLQK